MPLRSRLSILLVLILYFGTAGGVTAEAEAPALSVGNEWEYSVHMSLDNLIGQVEGGFEDMSIQGTIRMAVEPRQTVEVLSRTYDAWVIALEGDFEVTFTYTVQDLGPLTMTAPASLEGSLFLDNDSFEYVKSSQEITSRFSKFSVLFEMAVEVETSLDIETDTWHFPFDAGDTGMTTGQGLSYIHYVAKVNGEVVGEDEATVPYAYSSAYECVGLQPVDVEAGSFQAYELNVSSPGMYLFGYSEGYRHEYFSNEVNNSVEVDIYDSGDELIGEWNLVSYGESQDGAIDWTTALLVLLALVLLIIIIAIAVLLLRRKSREATAGQTPSSGKRACRRCGAEIPEGQNACPACGRTIR
ncbi:MAG: zinc ribbon domain-containing protein [Thermoplasmata archaeon]|nr:hypothetical protein [Candidatus Thermoplasmatota archaeon]MCK4949132.1 zinc ribbon domain-containing protein [Thermoplasmata archaeon]